jgi:hypothetical protein
MTHSTLVKILSMFLAFLNRRLNKRQQYGFLFRDMLLSRSKLGQRYDFCFLMNFPVVLSLTFLRDLQLQATDYLTLHLHRNSQLLERIWYPGKSGNCIQIGVYSNNPHVLVRYDIEGVKDQFLSIILSQHKKSNDLGYTLSCFCTEDFSLGTPKGDLLYVKDFASAWTPGLSGGPVGRPSFANNPMFAVKIPDGGAIMQLSVTTSTTSAVNALLVPVKLYGDGIDRAVGEAILDSGNYRHGFIATGKRKVKSGDYVIIVSNYHKGECAKFDLKVFSSCKLKTSVIS